MSRFSGKCDFYDFIEIYGFDHVKNSTIFVGWEWDKELNAPVGRKQVHIETMKDAVPYFPHIISMSVGNQTGSTIWLTEKSWVDMEEERVGPKPYFDMYRQELEEELKKYE